MSSESADAPLVFTVPEDGAGSRLDAFIASQLPEHSRVRLQVAISAGVVTLDGSPAKASVRLKAGQVVSVVVPPAARTGPAPENIPLVVLYEDEHLAVVDKPPGMVVHPAKGHWSGTLAGAIQHRFGGMSSVGGAARPGIVHRLDRDTSGVIVVARTDQAHMNLAAQFESREIEKEYFAITQGEPRLDRDMIDRPIGPHPYQREKMAIRQDHPLVREAQTFYEVVERFEGFAILRVLPKTGRTHQIRVHLASVNIPVLCDRLYGGRAKLTRGELARSGDETVILDRQALHARRIRLLHPATNEPLEFTAELPADLSGTVEFLRELRRRALAKKPGPGGR